MDYFLPKKIIIDSTHTLSVFKRYTPSEAISRRSHDLLATVRESGINRELYTKFPMVPVSKESNMMVEYAQSLLTNITEMGIAITTGIQEKMNYLQEALDDIAVRAYARMLMSVMVTSQPISRLPVIKYIYQKQRTVS